jgi:hypothetical protein
MNPAIEFSADLGSPHQFDRTYYTYSYESIFWLTPVEIWSKIRPELKRVSRRMDPGSGPISPMSTPTPSVPGIVGLFYHGQKESLIEETLRR